MGELFLYLSNYNLRDAVRHVRSRDRPGDLAHRKSHREREEGTEGEAGLFRAEPDLCHRGEVLLEVNEAHIARRLCRKLGYCRMGKANCPVGLHHNAQAFLPVPLCAVMMTHFS